VLTSFLAQFYEEVPPPRLASCRPRAAGGCFAGRGAGGAAGGKVEISVPQRGDRRRLIEQASRNAEEALSGALAESGTKARLNRELAEFLELPEPPQRIEVYDNSHIQGAHALGAMIVAGTGRLCEGPVPQVEHQDRPDQ
jgi:excinuclease ABC subunit C